MKASTYRYFHDVQAIAEAGLSELIEKKDDDEQKNHHFRNSVTALRGVDFSQDTEIEIVRLCDETWKRLTPFLNLTIHNS